LQKIPGFSCPAFSFNVHYRKKNSNNQVPFHLNKLFNHYILLLFLSTSRKCIANLIKDSVENPWVSYHLAQYIYLTVKGSSKASKKSFNRKEKHPRDTAQEICKTDVENLRGAYWAIQRHPFRFR
jgi:hypothetical protein